MKEEFNRILDCHNNLRNNSINLLPSENKMSDLATSFLSSDMGNRYFFKDPFGTSNGIKYSYSGSNYINEILEIGENLGRDLFNASYFSRFRRCYSR